MTRTTKGRVARDSAPPETLEAYIRRQVLRAEAEYQDAKTDFAKEFETNPAYAIEWKAEKMVKAQTRHVWWNNLHIRAGCNGGLEAIKAGKEEADRQVDSFFGSNSTCPWHNAMRRAEVETYNHILRRAVPELEDVAKGCSR